ncbi:MAG: AMP-binding protein [Anaerolineales bacterium]
MEETFTFGGEIVWQPSREHIERAHLTCFMQQHGIPNFDNLLRRSVEDVGWFTESVLKYLDIRFRTPYTRILDTSNGIAWARWCVDGELNIVENCLDKWHSTPIWEQNAVLWEGEEGTTRSLTYAELNAEVNRCANALRALGLGKGDAIGLLMPMTLEIVVALLAIVKIGAVVLPLFSGYGAGAVAARLQDAQARALFTADGFYRRGKPVFIKPIADEAVAQVPSLKHVIVLQRLNQPLSLQHGRDHAWDKFLAAHPPQADAAPTGAEDPLMVIYTSGTTGRPKGAIHTHCGFPIKAAQDMAFGTDVHAGDVIYWLTDMGWMMGPWLVFGALLLGATLLLYDGAPDYPAPDRLWQLVARHRVNQLGVSPTLIRALMPHGDALPRTHDLSSLRCFASTGEPWNPAPWLWLFEQVGGSRLPIINYSGGTEISGGIVMGNPLLPLKPCAFSAPCPGMAADVVDEAGNPVRNQVGELVITAPWIGMTRGFWRDPQRYMDTYWSRWQNVWVHGDFAAIDSDGLWYILGRSDDTLKIAGKRVGPAEVESLAVAHPEVQEAAAIGIPDELKGSALVVFCVLKPGFTPCEDLTADLNARIIAGMGKPMAPKAIHYVPDLPKTRNAKVMRRMIRAAYLGLELGDTSALVNPESLAPIQSLRVGD